MSQRITGKLRTQYIDEWLNGIENPDVEVKPMKTEGRFRVTYRKNKDSEVVENNDEPNNVGVSSNISENTGNENIENKPSDNENIENKNTEPENDEDNENEGSRNEVFNAILNQLRIINEERHAKAIKKEKKKELQQAIRKEFVRHRVLVEDPDPQPEPEPERIYIDRTPIRVRRRLNLIKQ